MNHVDKFFLGICLILYIILFGCGRQQPDVSEMITLSSLMPVQIPMEPDSVIEVKNWLAIGPFEFNPLLIDPAKSFFRNDLKQYGIKEGMIDDTALEKLQKRRAGVFLIDVPSPQIKLFRFVTGKTEKKSNFYLVARIHSAKTREATLIIDGSYSYTAWLNGNRLLEVRGKYNVNKAGDRFVNVLLKEGENMLFIKVNRGTNERSWDVICAIATRQEGERIFRVNYSGDFVVNPIINRQIEVYTGPYTNGRVEVFDANNQVVASGSFTNQHTNDKPFVISGLNRLEDGFYKTILSVGNEQIDQLIYKGNYSEFTKKVNASMAEINHGSAYSDDLKVTLQRIVFLNNKPKEDPISSHETRFVNRNKVFWGWCNLHNRLTDMLHALQHPQSRCLEESMEYPLNYYLK